MKLNRSFEKLGILIGSLPLLVGFQQCNYSNLSFDQQKSDFKMQMMGQPGTTFQAGNNGLPYYGKPSTYVSFDQICPNSWEPSAKVQLISSGAAFLTRENCSDLASPRPLPENEFQIDPIDSNLLTFHGVTFVKQDNLQTTQQRPTTQQNQITFHDKVDLLPVLPPRPPSVDSFELPAWLVAPQPGHLIICSISMCGDTTLRIRSMTDTFGNQFRSALPAGAMAQTGVCTNDLWYSDKVLQSGAGHLVQGQFNHNPILGVNFISCAHFSKLTGSLLLDRVVQSIVDPTPPQAQIVAAVKSHVIDIPVANAPSLVVGSVWATNVQLASANPEFQNISTSGGNLFLSRVVLSPMVVGLDVYARARGWRSAFAVFK